MNEQITTKYKQEGAMRHESHADKYIKQNAANLRLTSRKDTARASVVPGTM